MALELFPAIRFDVQWGEFSIYQLFFRLLPMAREAHELGDDAQLRRIYGFAEWCFDQKAKDMWNAAGVAFYEHLFDGPRSLWPAVVQWLSPQIIDNCRGLWEWRLTAEDFDALMRLIAERKPERYREASLEGKLRKPPTATER